MSLLLGFDVARDDFLEQAALVVAHFGFRFFEFFALAAFVSANSLRNSLWIASLCWKPLGNCLILLFSTSVFVNVAAV